MVTSYQDFTGPIHLTAEYIGGIDHAEVDIEAGVTVLSGANATNRTSLLQAIAAGIGSRLVTVKGDRSEGSVTLEINGRTYERTITRDDGHLRFSGDPLIEESQELDLFSVLLEWNEARQAAKRTGNLREVIMEPVDTDAIESQLLERRQEKARIENRLDELEQLRQRRSDLELERERITGTLDDLTDQFTSVEEAIETHELELDEAEEEQQQFEDALDDLREHQAELRRVRTNHETNRESIEALESELESRTEALEEVNDEMIDDVSSTRSEIETLRERQSAVETEISQLRDLLKFNKGLLQQGDTIVSLLSSDDESDLADELLPESDELVCWTCGSTVDRTEIETIIDTVDELLSVRLERKREFEGRIDRLTDQIDAAESLRRSRRSLTAEITEIEDELTRRRETIEELSTRQTDLEAKIAELEALVEDLKSEQESELLSLHEKKSSIEVQLDQEREQLENVEEELDEIETTLGEASDLDAELAAIRDDIDSLKTRVESLEQAAVEAFNEHMGHLLERLQFENIEQIWIEHLPDDGGGGESTFTLHIVRTTVDDEVYRDSVDHLSESEREVVGIVFALSGYFAHELYEEVPILLLDSLEAIDASRIASLIEYLEEYADYLVVALLTEDAEALDDELYHEVSF